jgi:hypothetical protein
MKPGRCKTVKVNCKYCGKEFLAIAPRVKVGWGVYCSRECHGKSQIKGKNKKYVGKHNAKITWDKTKNLYYAYWFDETTMKRKTTSYARWWWEVNVGEIPEGYVASYKNKDYTNISPDNIILMSPEQIGKDISKRLMGHKLSKKTREKISKSHTNGEWNGIGTDLRYSNWSKQLKEQIRERDNHACQACNRKIKDGMNGRIHHVDGDKHNSIPENLVLVCIPCHALIHCTREANNKILYYRSQLK